MTENYTPHATDRITNRLAGLVTSQDIVKINQIAPKFSNHKKVYYQVKKFSKTQHLANDINGDAIVAVIKNGRVVTVMLTKSWRKDYFSDGVYIQ